MPKKLTKKQMDNLKQFFQETDLDGSGYISKDELKKAMLRNGFEFSDEEFKSLCSEFDKDGNGKVNLEEIAEYIEKTVE